MPSHSGYLARWMLKHQGDEVHIKPNKEHQGLVDVSSGDEVLTLWISELEACWYDMLVGDLFNKR